MSPLLSSSELLKNGCTMTVSRPRRSRTTSLASPLPPSRGKLSITNGPAGTVEVWRSTSFTYSSTVEGAAESPVIAGSGWLTNPGVSA